MALPSSRPLYLAKLTHSSGATRRWRSLLRPPVGTKASSGVIGELALTSPVGFDRIDLGVVSVVSCIGNLLTGRRVGRRVVVRGVVGDFELASPIGFDRIDLFVASGGVVGIGYPFAAGTVVGGVVVRGVVGDFKSAPSAEIDGVDL